MSVIDAKDRFNPHEIEIHVEEVEVFKATSPDYAGLAAYASNYEDAVSKFIALVEGE